MTRRSVKEIEDEIKNYEEEYNRMINEEFCWATRRFRNGGASIKLNKVIRHITNLKLELNRAKMRDFMKGSIKC